MCRVSYFLHKGEGYKMNNELFANLGKVDTIAAGSRHTVGLKSDERWRMWVIIKPM